MSQTDGQAALCVCVKTQDFLSVFLQGDAQVDTGSGFANAAFLVDAGNDLSSRILFPLKNVFHRTYKCGILFV